MLIYVKVSERRPVEILGVFYSDAKYKILHFFKKKFVKIEKIFEKKER